MAVNRTAHIGEQPIPQAGGQLEIYLVRLRASNGGCLKPCKTPEDLPYLRRQNCSGPQLLHSRFRVRIIAAVLCARTRTASTSGVMRRDSKERKESVGGRSRDFRS
jgi:hypothetical protein